MSTQQPKAELTSLIDVREKKAKEVPFEEALVTIDEGLYTSYIGFVSGITTLSAIGLMQSMYYILPSVGCELDLSHVLRALLGSMTFIGCIVSSNFLGLMVDEFGRRKMLVITTFGSSLFSFLSSVAPNAIILLTTTFCAGLMLGGVFGLPYVYISEFCCSRIRSKYLTLATLIGMFATSYSPSIAWLVMWLDIRIPIGNILIFTPWRLYLILNALPMALSALLFFKLPESPKYLLLKGRTSEALDVLSTFYAVNSKNPKGNFPITSIRLDEEDEKDQKGKTTEVGVFQFLGIMYNQLKTLFTPPLLLYTFICSINMFGVIGLYGVLLLWVPEESSRMMTYLENNSNYSATLCEIMSNKNLTRNGSQCEVDHKIFPIGIGIGLTFVLLSIFLIFLVQKFKVKTILGVNIIVSSALCIAVIFSKSLFVTLSSLGLIVAILGASLSLEFSIIVDSFPTSLRATASVVALFSGRLTVPIGSSLLGAAFESHCTLAYSVISCLLLIVGTVCLTVPLKKTTAGSA